MIELSNVHVRYPGSEIDALREVSLTIDPGEFVLVAGWSGSGKSTLLRTLNGLVPHLCGGSFGGRVVVDGYDTQLYGPRVLSRVCGFVFQDPDAQSVADSVEEEIAFSLEQMGIPRSTMRIRVEEMLDLLGIAHLRSRVVATLSGGERQRVAVASAMALHPRILVLDEPTSQLDPWGADDLVHALQRLNQDLGITVVVAEHRLERFLPLADRLVWIDEGRIAVESSPDIAINALPDAALPPLQQLARRLECHPLPRTLKEARRQITWKPTEFPVVSGTPTGNEPAVRFAGTSVRRGDRLVLTNVSLTANFGEVVAIMGRNGSGKTTLLRSVFGFEHPVSGTVVSLGFDMRTTPAQVLGKQAAYLPQRSGAVLFNETVRAELAFTSAHRAPLTNGSGLEQRLGLTELLDRDPRDLSEGQRLRAALGAVLIGNPRLVVLDEPTRGLDGEMREQLISVIGELRQTGVCVLVATHDTELAAVVADRVILLGNGTVVADDSPVQVLGGSLAFSTQMARLFGSPFLTLDDLGLTPPPIVPDTSMVERELIP